MEKNSLFLTHLEKRKGEISGSTTILTMLITNAKTMTKRLQ